MQCCRGSSSKPTAVGVGGRRSSCLSLCPLRLPVSDRSAPGPPRGRRSEPLPRQNNTGSSKLQAVVTGAKIWMVSWPEVVRGMKVTLILPMAVRGMKVALILLLWRHFITSLAHASYYMELAK